MNKAGNKEILVHKNLSGQQNADEKAAFEKWKKEDNNHSLFDQLSSIWNQCEDIDFSVNCNTAAEWKKLSGQLSGAKVRKLSVGWVRAIAAVLVIGLIGTIALLTGFPNTGPAIAATYEVPFGKTQELELKDGSQVQINAGSSLSVVEGFNNEKRELLLDGEAYFEVASDKNKPFVIRTDEVLTTVVGTAFNLKAYPDDPIIRIHVTEGTVRFEKENGPQRTLNAGMAALYNTKTAQISELKFEEDANAWSRGVLIFDETPFSDVVRTLERTYAIKIKNNTDLTDVPYTSVFEQLSQEQAIKILRETFDFEVRENETGLEFF
ncbi:MAG: FecR domain-containing protein [Saprospiraceae bacterium]|nr:FecR domain-containing protein [Saprospiraceae bacterium]